MPEELEYSARLNYRVAYADTDQMGVVYYANYLVIFERLRNELLRRGDTNYRKLEMDGYYLPVVEAHVEYLRPARYDDLLDVRGRLAWVSGARIQIDYKINCESELLVEGYTIHAFIDRQGRPRRIPKNISDLFF